MAMTQAQKDWATKNREKLAKKQRDYYAQNSKRFHSYKIKEKYGISGEEYDDLLIQQNHRCAICKTPASELKKRLAVDHDHQTGRIRGLLCSKCNLLLGQIDDDPSFLSRIIAYLNPES